MEYIVKTFLADNEKELYSIDKTKAMTKKRAIANVKYKLFGNHRKGNMCSVDGGMIFHNFEFEAEVIKSE